MRRSTPQALRRAGAFAVALLLLGCAATPAPESAAQQTADKVTETRVKDALLASPDLYAFHVNVDSERGVVRLSGFVYSVEESQVATRVAMSVPGVQKVANDLEIKAGMVRPNR